MMRILSCFLLLSLRALIPAYASSSLTLSPFGSINDLLRSENPWHGFDSQDAILTVVRVHQFQSPLCEQWLQAVLNVSPGTELLSQEYDGNWTHAWKAWEPWTSGEKEIVESCNQVPCDVKLNETETSVMKSAKRSHRFEEYLRLVRQRSLFYKNTQVRHGYEFPGNPVDPWQEFEKRGFVSSAKRPEKPILRLRNLDFGSDKSKVIRQVFDRRGSRSSDLEATVWLRDVYTDHYFDSWGEWTHVSCGGASGKDILLIQALMVEFDLLKKTDLASRILRGKMRSAVEDNGKVYLDRNYQLFEASLKVQSPFKNK